MTINNLKNKKIAFLGLGAENYALLKFLLAKKTTCQITICDKRNQEALAEKLTGLNKHKNITWQLGQKFKDNLNQYDILFRSPGWPLHCPSLKQAVKKNPTIIITSPMRLFFDLCPTKNIIGITGTKGKGTTSSLIYQILKTHFRHSRVGGNLAKKTAIFLGGNIGIAPFEFIAKLKPTSWVVLELSSFQLEDLHTSPHIAVLTNFSREHLAPADPNNPNYHRNLTSYLKAKLNIVKYQKKSDYFVLNFKFKILNLKTILKSKNANTCLGFGKKIYFTSSSLPSKLVGEHNQENIAAAETVAKIIGIKKNIIAKVVKNFQGLEHRIEFVKNINGVRYYDDSFATTPESAITALKSFSAPIILLAGGADKGSNFKTFAAEIKKRAKFVCLLQGTATPKIQQVLNKLGFKNYKVFSTLPAALSIAKKLARPGDIVLLSTGCASFGMFANYKQRGDLFKTLVKKL